jgi:hypothetical protein
MSYGQLLDSTRHGAPFKLAVVMGNSACIDFLLFIIAD